MSRGLGDVYKRQDFGRAVVFDAIAIVVEPIADLGARTDSPLANDAFSVGRAAEAALHALAAPFAAGLAELRPGLVDRVVAVVVEAVTALFARDAGIGRRGLAHLGGVVGAAHAVDVAGALWAADAAAAETDEKGERRNAKKAQALPAPRGQLQKC